MDIIRWEPFSGINPFRNRMNHMFDHFFFPLKKEDESVLSWNPVADVYEDDDNYVIRAELPGVDKENISVDVHDRMLTLKGERSADNEVKKENYHRVERSFGQFQRSFTLPEGVDPDSVDASYKDGVLEVVIPKPEDKKAKSITVH
jgi:HSP20 family protein